MRSQVQSPAFISSSQESDALQDNLRHMSVPPEGWSRAEGSLVLIAGATGLDAATGHTPHRQSPAQPRRPTTVH